MEIMDLIGYGIVTLIIFFCLMMIPYIIMFWMCLGHLLKEFFSKEDNNDSIFD